MAMNKILVPIDASPGAKRALEVAVEIAAPNPDAHLELVYVVPIPLLDESQTVSFKAILDMMLSDGETLLAQAKEETGDVGDRVDTILLKGVNPASELLKLIDQSDYDLVVIGNRGLSGLKEYMGSISHKVLHGSNVPVLIAK